MDMESGETPADNGMYKRPAVARPRSSQQSHCYAVESACCGMLRMRSSAAPAQAAMKMNGAPGCERPPVVK